MKLIGVNNLILTLNLPSQCTLNLARDYKMLSLNLQTYQSYDIFKLLINLIQFFFYESKYFVSLTLAKCLMCRIYLCNYVLPGRLCRYSTGIQDYTSSTIFYLAVISGIHKIKHFDILTIIHQDILRKIAPLICFYISFKKKV